MGMLFGTGCGRSADLSVRLTPVARGFRQPTEVVGDPQDPDVLFVLERQGRIWKLRVSDGSRTLWADLTDRVGSRGGEQGLLGLAFAPDSPPRIYVDYTDRQGHTVVARFLLDRTGHPVLDQERRILYIRQPASNHNGGCLRFGPDSMLYIATGDGGRGGDPWNNAQNIHVLLGKMLRLDVRRDTLRIPPDNPFTGGKGRGEIWLYGLRNPWRFSFDRATGDLWIADVGQDRWEEVDHLPRGVGGKNLGWNLREGRHPFRNVPVSLDTLWEPVWEYGHDQGCSITGGFVYRGSRIPALQGMYLFGDFCTGRIWALPTRAPDARARLLLQTDLMIPTFGEDAAGEVYVADYKTGTLYRLDPAR